VAREARLSRAFADYDASSLDYILIDCPPSLGLLTVNALVAAAEVLIPIQCEYYALEGLEQLLRTIDLVKSHLNPTLYVSTILLTMYDGRTRLASQVAEEVREHFGEVVLSTVIPRSVRVSEAPSYGQSVMTYDPGSSGAQAYLEAAREVADRAAELGQTGLTAATAPPSMASLRSRYSSRRPFTCSCQAWPVGYSRTTSADGAWASGAAGRAWAAAGLQAAGLQRSCGGQGCASGGPAAGVLRRWPADGQDRHGGLWYGVVGGMLYWEA
jgi:hypothetical protein